MSEGNEHKAQTVCTCLIPQLLVSRSLAAVIKSIANRYYQSRFRFQIRFPGFGKVTLEVQPLCHCQCEVEKVDKPFFMLYCSKEIISMRLMRGLVWSWVDSNQKYRKAFFKNFFFLSVGLTLSDSNNNNSNSNNCYYNNYPSVLVLCFFQFTKHPYIHVFFYKNQFLIL